MKAPANFDRQWYYMVKDEARRVAREIINQATLGRNNHCFINVEVDADISQNLVGYDVDRFLSYFDCPGLYMTKRPGCPNYIVTVRSDLVKLNILAPVHKVKPIRIHKSHKV